VSRCDFETVDEAVAKKADLIVSHHPVIFKGLKRINEDDPKGISFTN